MKPVKPEIKNFKKNNITFRYIHYRSDGPTLIMLHATGFFPYMWHPIARELAGEFNIIAPYFCDHRVRDPHKGGQGWKELADDLCLLCSELHLESPYLVGHSMGGTVMTIAAGVHEVSPMKMILIEPIYLPENLYEIDITVEQHPLASKSIKRRNNWKSREEARNYLLKRKLFKHWDEEMLNIYIEHGLQQSEEGDLKLACHPEKEASLFMGGNQFNPWSVMSKISCPVLMVEGEKSENSSYIDLPKAASIFQDAQLQTVEGAGHLIPMEKPEETVSLIKDFFC